MNKTALFRLTFASLVVIMGMITACQDPPIPSLTRAQKALEDASKSGALRHAAAKYRQAEKYLTEGRMEIARQKGRLAVLRDYRVADSLLAEAFDLAEKSRDAAVKQAKSLRNSAHSQLSHLRTELTAWRTSLDGSLTMFNAERHWSSAQLAANTADRLIDAGEYAEALAVLSTGRNSLSRLSGVLDEYADDAASKIGVWRRWVRETVEASAKRKIFAVIVDKSAHKLYLINSGKLVKTLPCELGYNSSLQKFFAGDGATPEGQYHVAKYKARGSKYYKALLLDYPNNNDRLRFKSNKARGIISSDSKIGGLIEIHGDGGSARDWTDGCVAVSNQHMDYLMQNVTVGTPVTIVRRSDMWP